MEIYSTLTRTKARFQPREPGKVSMYCCGPTVYDAPHLGHARSALVFDVIRRYLEYRGFEVTYVSNFTDIDDNIIERAERDGVTWDALAEKYIGVWRDYMARLGVRPPDIAPKATENVDAMIELISELLSKGHAYSTEGGDVYFSISSYPAYGELSGRDVRELEAGSRVEPGEGKRDPLDFALWKASKPGEPTWESPWGPGRPGWHIECSAMSLRFLGEGFDIHGGGQDLIFPHHENELAQSRAAEKVFAKVWMHHGLVNLSGEKMSKSTGHFVTLEEALEQSDPPVLRLLSLQSHYRSPVEFGPDEVAQASKAWGRMRGFTSRAADYISEAAERDAAVTDDSEADSSEEERGSEAVEWAREAAERVRSAFDTAMDDDFATPAALGAIFSAVREGNQLIDKGAPPAAVEVMKDVVEELSAAMGLFPSEAVPAALQRLPEVVDRLVELLLEVRQHARSSKDFETSDLIRDRLGEVGVAVEDTSTGVKWRWRDGDPGDRA